MRILKSVLVEPLLASSRYMARSRFRRLPRETARALVIPPTALGSIGDAAMLNTCRNELRKRGFSHVAVAMPAGWEAIEGFDRYIPGDDWFFNQRRSALARLIFNLGDFSHSFLIGADCIDGVYNPGSITRRMTLLNEHAKLGGRARIMGASFSTTPDSAAVARLRTLEPSITVCARDTLSYKRMVQATGRPIVQTADLAFLTEPAPSHRDAAPALAFIAEQKAMGRHVIGLNINSLIEQKHGGFADAHRALVSALLDGRYSLLLVPHDSRGEVNDAALLRRVTADIAPDARDRIGWLNESPPAATSAVLAKLDAIVTSRMHAAILAMSAQTPAISFTYQGKFEGMYDLLGLSEEGLLFQPEDLISSQEPTITAILSQIDRREALTKILSARLDDVAQLAGANFD